MLPRLQAQERLAAITDGAMAAGSVDRRTQRETIDRLEELAGFERRRPTKATPAILSGMGISITVVPAAPEKALNDG